MPRGGHDASCRTSKEEKPSALALGCVTVVGSTTSICSRRLRRHYLQDSCCQHRHCQQRRLSVTLPPSPAPPLSALSPS
eukprot:10286163-Prorocentrum_lima.AAC.1